MKHPVYNRFSYITLTFCVLLLSSCEKFLDKKSNPRLVVPTSLTDLQGLLDRSAIMNEVSTPSYGEESADSYFLPEHEFNARDYSNTPYLWNPVNSEQSGNDWGFAYKAIYVANYCLESLEKIDIHSGNKEKWNNVYGSALLYRSYHFLNLVWNYSKVYQSATAKDDPGIVLKLVADYNSESKRASIAHCYEKVLHDTKAALPYLPKYALHVMRPSKVAAYGLLARAYLSMGDYSNAGLYADSCLQIQSILMDFNGDSDIDPNIGQNYPFKNFNKEVIFYTEMRNNSLTRTDTRSRVDTNLISMFNENDLRKIAYFSNVGFSGANLDGYSTFKGGYSINGYFNFTGLATDELYLIRAEAYIRTDKVQKGLDDLNTLLATRWKSGEYVLLSGLNSTQALDILHAERRKELIFRGVRWIDIKRQNRDGGNIALKRFANNITYTLEPNAALYALPIPEDIIRITGMPQNSTDPL